MQNAAAPRVIFRKEAILRHIKREDSSVLPSFERRGELGILWLSVAILLSGCMVLTMIPSTCTVQAVVVTSNVASGLCLSVPAAGREVLRGPIRVAVDGYEFPAAVTKINSGERGCSLLMVHDSSQRGGLIALWMPVPRMSREQADALQSGRHVQLAARIRIRDLVRNGLMGKRGDGE